MVDFTAVPDRIGDHLVVFIPEDVARAEGIEEGRPVRLTVSPLPRRTDLLGKHPGIGSFHRSETDLWDR